MGSLERWGSNKNADAFPRMGLMNSDPDTYGFKTFEKHAYIYQHHQNKDPAKSIGKVAYAFWDDQMDKVMCLFYLLKDLAPELVNRLEEGGSFPMSMGCRCPFDICSICGNKAPTRKEYCSHLSLYPNQMMPDATKAMAITPHPKFFDLSHVLRGADPIAHALRLVDPGQQAKMAWDNRTKYFPMYRRNEDEIVPLDIIPIPLGVDHGLRMALMQDTLDWVRKVAAPLFGHDGIPLGDPDAPRMSPAQLDAYMCEPLNKVNSEDLKNFRRKFHATLCKAPDGEACTCSKNHQKESADATKGADITKRIDAMATKVPEPPQEENPDVEDFAKGSLPVLEASEEPIDVSALDEATDKGATIGEILASLLTHGIVIRPEEFRRALLKIKGHPALAEQLDEAGVPGFGPADAIPAEEAKQALDRSWAPEIAQISVLHRHRNRALEEKFARFAPNRSGRPLALYKRALSLLEGTAQFPPGTKIIVIPPQEDQQNNQMLRALAQRMPQRQDAQRFSALVQTPQIIPTLLAMKALYGLYRSNLGQSDVQKAFDTPPNLNPLAAQPHFSPELLAALQAKQANVTDAIARSRLVPSTAYFKYAYISPFITALPEPIRGELRGPSILVENMLSGPLRSPEKLAMILDLKAPDLVDAATILSLRCVGGALNELFLNGRK